VDGAEHARLRVVARERLSQPGEPFELVEVCPACRRW